MSEAILILLWQGENFFQVEKFEISHFQAGKLYQKKRYITQGIQPISKNLSCC